MKLLGKKSKIILISLIAVMLTVTAISLAMWDVSGIQPINGEMAQYANAKIGDIVTYGSYYQDADGLTKTPIEWLVVDKNEDTSQLTLLSKHVLAGGSFWGNWFADGTNTWGYNSPGVGSGPGGITYNQNWADSTLRAWLNNLERTDVHGDKFTAEGIKMYENKVVPSLVVGLQSSGTAASRNYQHSDLFKNIGYSNKNYWTGITTGSISGAMPDGYFIRTGTEEVYYTRTKNTERPAVNGFLDEAFTPEEQQRIVPKVIPGQESHQWPNNSHSNNNKVLTPATIDKIWVPSTAELNIAAGIDWSGQTNDGNGGNNWSVGTDSSTSTSFAFFRQFTNPDDLKAALRATGTTFDRNSQVSNYSIPLDVSKDNIGSANTQNDQAYTDLWGEKGTRYYWTRTPSSYWYSRIGCIPTSGAFSYDGTDFSNFGARPAMILSYV